MGSASKPKKIQLARIVGGKEVSVQDFGFEHALNLLRLQQKTGSKGWKIKSEDWKFVKNEIIKG